MRALGIVALIAAMGLATGARAQENSGGSGGGSQVPNNGPGNATDTTGTTRSGPMSRSDCEAWMSRSQQSGGAQLSGPQRNRFMSDCMARRK